MGQDTIKIPCSKTIGYIIYAFTFLVIIMVIIYLRTKSKEKSKNEDKMSDTYPSNAPLRSVSKQEADCKYLLRDYYIKSAYNCCAINNFKNSFVSKKALKICLAQGCRCLDFEIYSIDNKPVISVSDKKDYNVKGTYNSIPFDEMLNIINSNAFGSGAPNPNDPLILHFRIKTENKSIYDQMASDILANIDNQYVNYNVLLHEAGHANHYNNVNAEDTIINWGISGIDGAGFWSRWYLWSYPTVEGVKKFMSKRFGIIFYI
jgi:hypothetical protein